MRLVKTVYEFWANERYVNFRRCFHYDNRHANGYTWCVYTLGLDGLED